MRLIILSLVLLFSSCIEKQTQPQVDNSTREEYGFIAGSVYEGKVQKVKLWENGQTITFAFKGGSKKDHENVKKFSKVWTRYGNVEFDFIIMNSEYGYTAKNYDVQITFEEDAGSHANVGKTSFSKMNLDPEMLYRNNERNLQRHIVHEFGHVLGFTHEHLRDDRPFTFDEEKVYAEYKPKDGWTIEKVKKNMLDTRPHGKKIGDYDINSIMHYGFEADLLDGEEDIATARFLSIGDKLSVAMTYPGKVKLEDIKKMHNEDLAIREKDRLKKNLFGICKVVRDEDICSDNKGKFTIKIASNGDVALNDDNKFWCGSEITIREEMREESMSVCTLESIDEIKKIGTCEIKEKGFRREFGSYCPEDTYSVFFGDGELISCANSIQSGVSRLNKNLDRCL